MACQSFVVMLSCGLTSILVKPTWHNNSYSTEKEISSTKDWLIQWIWTCLRESESLFCFANTNGLRCISTTTTTTTTINNNNKQMKDMIKLLKDQRKDGIFSVSSLHVSAASTYPLWCGQLLPSVHSTGILSTSSTGSLPIDRPESCVGLYRCKGCSCCVCLDPATEHENISLSLSLTWKTVNERTKYLTSPVAGDRGEPLLLLC